MVIGPNGRELEAGPPGPLEDKPAGGDLGAWLHSFPTPPRELRWISTVCHGGRLRERGIEAQKAPYTAPDRFRPGFEPPLTDVSWVGLAALGVRSTSGTTPLRARILGFGGRSYQIS